MASPKVSVLLALADQITQPLRGIKGSLDDFRGFVKDVGKTVAAAFAVDKIIDFFKSCVAEAAKAEQSMARLGKAVENAGGDFQALTPQIEATVESVMKLSTATDDDLNDALTRLISISGDVTGSLENLQLVTDVAAFSGKSLAESADLVGRLMTGNTRPLREFGISATDSADGMRQLREMTAGFAELEAGTLNGKLKQLGNTWGEFKEEVGKAITGSADMKGAAEALITTINGLAAVVGAVKYPIAGFVQVIQTLADGAVATFSTIYQAARASFGGLLELFGTVGTAAKGLLKAIGIDLGEGIAESWKAMGQRIKSEGLNEIVENWNASNQQLRDTWLGTQAELTETAKAGADNRRRLTGDEVKAIVAMQDGGFDQLTSAQKRTLGKLQGELKQHGGATLKLTKEQLEGIESFTKAAHVEAEKAEKERLKKIETLDKMAFEASLLLLNDQHRAYLELTQKFNDQMVGLRGKDLDKAKEQLTEAQAALLQKWAGFERDVVPTVKRTTGKLVESTDLQASSLQGLEGKLEQLTERTTGFTEAQIEAWRKSQEWRQRVLEISDSIREFTAKLGTAAQDLEPLFGREFTDQILTAIGAIDQMGEAVGRIATGDIMGGITQGVGALVSLGKTIFGGSDLLKKQFEKNTHRLEELRGTMGDLIRVNSSGAAIAGVQSALGGLDLRQLRKLEDASPGAADKAIRAFLTNPLLAQGLGFGDLDELAKDLGIEIKDDKGRYSTRLLEQLLQALGDLDTDFAQTFEGQRDRIEQGVGIGAIGNELAAAVQLLRDPKLGSSAIAQALAGLDPENLTGEARTGAIAKLRDLFTNIGSLDKAALGGLNRQQFGEALEWLIGLLSDVEEAAATAPETPVTTPAPASPAVAAAVAQPIETGEAVVDILDLVTTANVHLASIDAAIQASTAAAARGEDPRSQMLWTTMARDLERLVEAAEQGNVLLRVLGDAIQRQSATAGPGARDLNEQLALLYQQELANRGSAVRVA